MKPLMVALLSVASSVGGLTALTCRAETPQSETVFAQAAPRNGEQLAWWPQFRGPNAAGVAASKDLPVQLGPQKNLLWKTPIPPGNSSPCVWGDAVFLTAFTDTGGLQVLCLDAGDGRVRWHRRVPAERIERVHPVVGSPASPTPATDGRRVYVFFGSVGLVAFDFQGRRLWTHKLGPFTYHMGWGAASSPIVCGETVLERPTGERSRASARLAPTVVLNCDHDGDSFLLALDGRTGRQRWRTPRPEAPPSYSTPVVWEADGRRQIIVSGSGWVCAYEAATGQRLWRLHLPEAFVATTPVLADGLLLASAVDRNSATGEFRVARAGGRPNFDGMFANHDGNRDGKLSPEEVPRMNKATFDRIDADRDGFLTREELQAEFWRQREQGPPSRTRRGPSGNVLMAVRLAAASHGAEPQVAWRVARSAPYVASPLVYGQRVYVVRRGGIVSCFALESGRRLWRQRAAAPGAYYASPVAGDGKVYFVSEGGQLTVLAAGDEPRVLARSSLGERCLATPAIVGGRIYIRTQSSLYCFGKR